MNLCFYKLRVIIIPSVDRVACFPPPPFEPPPVQAGVLNSPIQPLDIGNAFGTTVPDFSTKFYTTVIVKSTNLVTLSYFTMQTWVLSNLLHQTMTIFFLKQPTILLLHLGIHDLNMRDILVRLKPLPLLQDLRHNLPVPLFHLSLGPYMLKHLRWQMLV